MNQAVFHIRLPRFPIQVERTDDSSLATRPVGIISSGNSNGTIISLSPEAEEEGLRPGMNVSLAQKMSPRTTLLPANSALYNRAHQAIYGILQDFCPIIEPGNPGQFYLDMHGMEHLYKSYRRAGDLVTRSIEEKATLYSQVGISRNKLISAISTRVVPDRLFTVQSGEEVPFLSPLPRQHLPIVGKKPVQSALDCLNARMIEHIQHLTVNHYTSDVIFGEFGTPVRQQSHGIDTSAVRPPAVRDHIVERVILEAATNDEDVLQGAVQQVAEQVAFQLRQQNRLADKVIFHVHYTDSYENTAAGAFTHHSDRAVIEECRSLYGRANTRRNRIRAVMVDVSDFRPYVHQMDLFEDAPSAKDDALSRQLDTLREKYGQDVVGPASAFIRAA
ncbi:MAG: hypothetical protein K9N46_09640 [Candidatus Marinimicrobia bacterium]|nr:hypothetical protein [Candidatus Neomarinimicrobiota bacterium]MCF7828419.1 hypothetical protein [Candidatus Neomarinimicrobiota bacterium]MCF7880987.1 hypothetical protein [Candidatus Neomarinimicrobiota bacterium]